MLTRMIDSNGTSAHLRASIDQSRELQPLLCICTQVESVRSPRRTPSQPVQTRRRTWVRRAKDAAMVVRSHRSIRQRLLEHGSRTQARFHHAHYGQRIGTEQELGMGICVGQEDGDSRGMHRRSHIMRMAKLTCVLESLSQGHGVLESVTV